MFCAYMSAILTVEDLHKSYGNVRAVDGIEFGIEKGICFGLLGPNGAGKTTAIEIMEGILRPDRGRVLFQGEPIDGGFKEKVGIQFQTTALPEFITVKETIDMFSAFYPDPRPLEEVADLCALGDLLKRDNAKLSGGQRQRLLLAIAIIPRPQLVFLDEPTTGLDPQARRNFWDLIAKIKGEDATVVLTTHYMEEAELLCDQVAIMDHGTILENDSPARLISKYFAGAVVHVPGVGPELRTATDRLPDGASFDEDGLRIVSANLDATMKELLDARVNLDGLRVHKPDLEDLFIMLTGSSLRS
jgi:ABC-2 type transport system ATP-binding protein